MTDDISAPSVGLKDATANPANVLAPSLGHRRVAQPIHTERPMKIICIGAGASGLLFAYKLQRSFEKFDLTIYEKNPDIAGTWFENRYPGYALPILSKRSLLLTPSQDVHAMFLPTTIHGVSNHGLAGQQFIQDQSKSTTTLINLAINMD